MIGIIGGTGLYNIEGLDILEKLDVATPFGRPSAPLIKGEIKNTELIFLPRHGETHRFLPSEVNYRANIYALKSVGVTQVIGVSAVGSLRKEIAPGNFAIPSQYFDHTRGKRESTFFGNGLAAHVSTAEPTCPALTQGLKQSCHDLGFVVHTDKSYACVEGPRLGTKVESHFLRDGAKCDLVGMTNVPEVFLAREAQLCYATLTIATDYDCWLDDPNEHVSVAMVFQRFGESLERAKTVLKSTVTQPRNENCSCRNSLKFALITPEDSLNENQTALLSVLKK